MRKTTRLLICLLLVLAMPAAAMGLPMIGVEGAVGVWWTSPSGNLKTGSDNDFLDMEDDFSFSRETELFGRLKVDMPLLIPNAYVMANPLKWSERTSRAIRFGGKRFLKSSEAEFNLNQYDFGLFYAIPFLQTATLDRFNVDAGLNLRFIDAETSVSQGVLSEAESMSIVIPQVYLGAQFQPVERFSVEAEARGLTYKSDSSYSLLGRVKATAFGPVFVSGGYRYDDYDIDKSGFMMDFNFSGPFVETGLSF